jgi:AcrR family transcriptional regulator
MPVPDRLRERKKQATRDSISAIATRLFIERGFDRVTIADVAAAAEVSKMTVTNYFPRKEDMVFDLREQIVDGPRRAVLARPSGQSVTDAVRLWFRACLAANDPTIGAHGAAFDRLVTGSRTLLAAEREMWERREIMLAEAIAQSATDAADGANSTSVAAAGGDYAGEVPVTVRVRAAALSGVLRSVHDQGRRLTLSGQQKQEINRVLGSLAEQAFDLVRPVVG